MRSDRPNAIMRPTGILVETKRYVNERQRKKPRCLGETFYGMVKRERRTNLAIRSQFNTMYNVHSFHHYATIPCGYSFAIHDLWTNQSP